MNAPDTPITPTPSAAPDDLDLLLASISDAIDSLVNWDVAAFESAVERQRAICQKLELHAAGSASEADIDKATRIREQNHVYDRLLQHSAHWTRTIHNILRSASSPADRRPSVNFRG